MKNKIIKQTAIFNGKDFEYFGIHPHLASVYGKRPEDIINVQLTISDNQIKPPPPQDDNEASIADYWGWWDNQHQNFTMVYAKYFLLEMCFAYGIEPEEKRRKGKAYRLNVTQIKP